MNSRNCQSFSFLLDSVAMKFFSVECNFLMLLRVRKVIKKYKQLWILLIVFFGFHWITMNKEVTKYKQRQAASKGSIMHEDYQDQLVHSPHKTSLSNYLVSLSNSASSSPSNMSSHLENKLLTTPEITFSLGNNKSNGFHSLVAPHFDNHSSVLHSNAPFSHWNETLSLEKSLVSHKILSMSATQAHLATDKLHKSDKYTHAFQPPNKKRSGSKHEALKNNSLQSPINKFQSPENKLYEKTDHKLQPFDHVAQILLNSQYLSSTYHPSGSFGKKLPPPVLLLTTPRSGSTFLGDLLSHALNDTFHR